MHKLILSVVLALSALPGHAAEPANALPEPLRKQLETLLPGVQVDAVRPAPLKGFYELVLGTQIIYLSEDGKYLVLGEILDAAAKSNLTQQRRAELIAAKLAEVGRDKMIIIGPKDPERYVTVFTDVDCPYCAKFHRDVPRLNEAGVEVRYLLFPRTGVGSRSYFRAVSVWCADDPAEAVGVAKAGGEIELRNCDNPVKEHMQMGADVGVQGTPAIILDNGKMIAGYVPAKELLEQLDLAPKPQNKQGK